MPFGLLGIGFVELMILVIGIAAFTFWIWMIVDCAMQEPDPVQKVVWIIVITVVGVIGAPLYFLFRKLPRRR